MAAAVEGLGNNDRDVLTVHAEALKTADKYAKDKYSDNALRRVIKILLQEPHLRQVPAPFSHADTVAQGQLQSTHQLRGRPMLSPMLSNRTFRCAAAGIYRAVGKVGAAGLWAYAGYAFEETARICVDGLYQPDRAVQVICAHDSQGTCGVRLVCSRMCCYIHKTVSFAREQVPHRPGGRNTVHCIYEGWASAVQSD